jgi:drug/metabolite transporter (DMT)-like permease
MKKESERGFSKGVQLMLVATFLFVCMNVFVKKIPHIPVMEIILFRSLVSLVLSLSYIKYYKLSPFGVQKKFLLIRGFFGAIALILFFATLQNIPLGSAVTIRYLTPLFTALFGIFILGERVRRIQWLFFGIALIGVFLVKGFDTRISWTYFLMGVGSAFFSGIAYNSIRKMKDSDHPMVIILYFPLVALPVCAVWSFFDWVQPVGWDWVHLFMIGLLTQAAQYFMTRAYHSDKVAKVSSVNYIGLVFALAFGVLLFDETYDWKILSGMLVVLAGVFLNIYHKRIRFGL